MVETELTGDPDGKPHREINPETGQQLAYVVLSEAERAKGYVEPYRRRYIHEKCGGATTMAKSIAETYARDPKFYGATFCATCKEHFPIGENGEFVWDGTDQKVGTRRVRPEEDKS